MELLPSPNACDIASGALLARTPYLWGPRRCMLGWAIRQLGNRTTLTRHDTAIVREGSCGPAMHSGLPLSAQTTPCLRLSNPAEVFAHLLTSSTAFTGCYRRQPPRISGGAAEGLCNRLYKLKNEIRLRRQASDAGVRGKR